MATTSSLLFSIAAAVPHPRLYSSPSPLLPCFLRLPPLSVSLARPLRASRHPSVKAVAEEAATAAANEEEEAPVAAPTTEEAPVAVSVSPSDILTMFFQAEGTIAEPAIPTVIKALEGSDGISDLKVQVSEGIATVELTKQTTVQATGVASNLVEIIQGSGFKLQTLNLSFEDEEDAVS